MSDLKSFLDWFEGFAENIKKQPTPDQWRRIKARVADLQKMPIRQSAAYTEEGMPAVTTPKPEKRMDKPKSARQWKAQYKGYLIEHGMDEESAKDFTDMVTVDLDMDPEYIARQDLGPMAANGA